MKVLVTLIIASFLSGLDASINSSCLWDKDCDVLDSYCGREGRCTCLNGFVEYKGDCTEIIPSTSCLDDLTCKGNTLQSVCVNSKCTCIPYHHYTSDGECIRNRGLYERCFYDNQCYWGRDMVGKMSCIMGSCSCNAGYHQVEDRKCGNASSNVAIFSFANIFIAILRFVLFN